MREPIENEYFNWLCAKVLHGNSQNYYTLLRILYKTEFIWVVPFDENRMEDGIELRQDFLREVYIKRDRIWEREPCSVLEVFLSMAKRASFETDIPVRDWFWTFMRNLGLDEYRHISDAEVPIIENILYTFIWRTYEPSGLGGMFPMSQTQHDQREIELWYQFCEYVEEQGLL